MSKISVPTVAFVKRVGSKEVFDKEAEVAAFQKELVELQAHGEPELQQKSKESQLGKSSSQTSKKGMESYKLTEGLQTLLEMDEYEEDEYGDDMTYKFKMEVKDGKALLNYDPNHPMKGMFEGFEAMTKEHLDVAKKGESDLSAEQVLLADYRGEQKAEIPVAAEARLERQESFIKRHPKTPLARELGGQKIPIGPQSLQVSTTALNEIQVHGPGGESAISVPLVPPFDEEFKLVVQKPNESMAYSRAPSVFADRKERDKAFEESGSYLPLTKKEDVDTSLASYIYIINEPRKKKKRALSVISASESGEYGYDEELEFDGMLERGEFPFERRLIWPDEEEEEEEKMTKSEYIYSVEGEEQGEEDFVEKLSLAESVHEIFTGSETQQKAQRYLKEHKIFELFHFLTSHLLANSPENPVDFLIDLLDKCLLFRSGHGPPPLLMERRHIESLFSSMDPMQTGFIDMDQYKTGMITLGIGSYNAEPQTENELVAKETFVEEAYSCLVELLEEMVGINFSECSHVGSLHPESVTLSAFTWSTNAENHSSNRTILQI